MRERDLLQAWHDEHDHGLHDAATMRDAVARALPVRSHEDVPYLYHYLEPVLVRTPEATAFLASSLEEERDRANAGQIELIGRRLVAG